jgi:predicted lipoprotein with Yx(FWY)xxD motif
MKSLLALLPVAVAVAAVGCGGSSSGKKTAALKGTTTPAATAAAPAVDSAKTSLGRVLVDSHGRTLYLFEADHGTSSSCYGSCAGVWPPLTVPGKAAAAGSGVTASKLGASARKDGSAIVTYSGHPRYTYAGDQKPGDVKGQDVDQFGGEWYALSPSGEKVDN